jgi:hypothetical protein
MITATHLKPSKSPVFLLVPNGDFYHVTEHLTEAEGNVLKRVRSFYGNEGCSRDHRFLDARLRSGVARSSIAARQSVIRRPRVIGRRYGVKLASRLTPELSTRSQRLRSS